MASIVFYGWWTPLEHGMQDVILPLGVSFFTFTQIGYRLDCNAGIAAGVGQLQDRSREARRGLP